MRAVEVPSFPGGAGAPVPSSAADASVMPFSLPANQLPDRFYLGGPQIAAFRGAAGAPATGTRVPEDWVASTTTLFGESSLGLSALADGTVLRDAVAADPELWLGADHVAAFGPDSKLLVKLLDAGQRLPVHAHPDTEFAGAHLGRSHGKAEAWHLLEDGEVHVGLRRPIEREAFGALVRDQRVEQMLELLHPLQVAAGDTVFVPPGTLHAIGAGILLVELQEPEDLSVLCEWRDFELDGAADGHLGLGFDLALRSVDFTVLTSERAQALVRRSGSDTALPPDAAPFFRLDIVSGEAHDAFPAGLAVVVVLDGDVVIRTDHGSNSHPRGSTVLVPAAAGALHLHGGTAALCRPPLPGPARGSTNIG